MKLFKDYKYVSPDLNTATEELKGYIEKINSAKTYQEFREAILDHDKIIQQSDTMWNVAYIRNSLDTADEFYANEILKFSTINAQLSDLDKKAMNILLNSSFLEQFKEEFGDYIIKKIETSIRLSNPEVLKFTIKESELMHEYNKLISSTVTNFNGEECSFIKLSKYMQNEDRNVRQKAFYAWSDMYKSISEKLDGIYDELIITRNNIAKTLEFDSYIDYVYTSKCRYNYNPEDVVKFRENVLKHIVPVCEKILDNQRKRLGVDKLERYDELLTDVDGNATPIGDKNYILDVARKMFGELSLETKEFFEFMTEHELYDLDARFGKQSGGYCATLTSEKSPFIFANFNGTNHDITVLTHESGHAFESYTASRLYPLTSLIHSSSEVAEIHSMSMELLAYPWMEGFFGDKADRYRTRHLEKALIAVPFIICVDEFQHMVFENNLNAEGRRKAWRDLERKYMPWRSYDRNEFLESGGFWMQQSHMFTVPFYYIEYGLAQLSAFDIYRNVDRDYKIGWEQYLKLCKSAGTRGYFDTLDYAQVANPFKEETIRNITKFLEKKLL